MVSALFSEKTGFDLLVRLDLGIKIEPLLLNSPIDAAATPPALC